MVFLGVWSLLKESLMLYLYLTLYLMTVAWLVAIFLYADGTLLHSKTEVVFAPILGISRMLSAGVRWGFRPRGGSPQRWRKP